MGRNGFFRHINIIRWIILIPVTFLTSFFISIPGLYLLDFIGIWYEYVYCFSAIIWIVSSYLIAPPLKKVLTTFISLVVGCGFAIYWIKISYYPEGHSTPYEPTALPLIFCLFSALLTFLLIRKFHEKRTKDKEVGIV